MEKKGNGAGSVEYSSVLQGCPFGVMVSTHWSVIWQGRGSLVIAFGPSVAYLVLLLFWVWS